MVQASAVDRATVAAVAAQTRLLHKEHINLRQQVINALTELAQMNLQVCVHGAPRVGQGPFYSRYTRVEQGSLCAPRVGQDPLYSRCSRVG